MKTKLTCAVLSIAVLAGCSAPAAKADVMELDEACAEWRGMAATGSGGDDAAFAEEIQQLSNEAPEVLAKHLKIIAPILSVDSNIDASLLMEEGMGALDAANAVCAS